MILLNMNGYLNQIIVYKSLLFNKNALNHTNVCKQIQIIWYQAFLSNANNLLIDLFYTYMRQ